MRMLSSYLGLRLVELGDYLVHPPGGVLDDGADSLEAALQIRDVPLSRIRLFSIPDPGSTSKNLSILTQKIVFEAPGNMIRVVHPGSGS
jgi:hypothetical protein